MPITRRQFELEIDTEIEQWMVKISAFLVEHKDEAFTSDELWKTIYAKLSWESTVREAFLEALDKLVEIQAAGKRIIRGTNYYAFRE